MATFANNPFIFKYQQKSEVWVLYFCFNTYDKHCLFSGLRTQLINENKRLHVIIK